MRNTTNRRRGVVNIWVIMTLFLMVALIGLACDAGWSVLTLSKLQAAADSAALAGAALVKADQDAARLAAHDLAIANTAANVTVKLDLNTGNAPGGDIVIGRWDRNARTFTETTSSPNAVKVVANRTSTGIDGRVPLIFGPSFGANTVSLSRTAIAMIQGGTGAGMLVLNPTAACSLSVGGNATLNVFNGNIQVNSTNSCAVCNNGNPIINAPNLNITGGSCLDSGILNGTQHTGTAPIPDPLAALPAPSPFGTTYSVGHSGNVTINPGYYPAGIERNAGGHLVMNPGVYVVEGDSNSGGFNIGLGVDGTLTANGVMIYVKSGKVRINAGGHITLTPPGPDYPSGAMPVYEHVTIFQARTNTLPGLINGNADMNIVGALYFPNNHIEMGGTGLGNGTQLIANTVAVTGNGIVSIAYDGSFPGIVTTTGDVFLVE